MTPTSGEIIIHIIEIGCFTSKSRLEALRKSLPLVRVGWRRSNARSNAAFAEMQWHSAKHVHVLMDARLGIVYFLLQSGSFSNPHGATLSVECSVLRTLVRTALTAPTHRVQFMGVCTFYLCLLTLATIKIQWPGCWRYRPCESEFSTYCTVPGSPLIDHIDHSSKFDGIRPSNVSPQSYHLDKRVVPVRFRGKESKWFKALSCTEHRDKRGDWLQGK